MIFILMGVCGCGKTTVGEALAKKLGCAFGDADDFHTVANKAKMSRSIPLTDEDRVPWLQAIHKYVKRLCSENKDGVVTCSALKKMYRIILVSGETTPNCDKDSNLPVIFVHLKGSRELLQRRMDSRTGHFMPASLLESQLRTLEEPDSSEYSLTVDIDDTVRNIVDLIVNETGRLSDLQI